jgi:tetratricopeptide (TPR) repeat protein
MTQQNPLDLKGIFLEHPFPELLVEIGEARLDGSLRLSYKDKKTIVYFERGKVIFAVSNSKRHRLFSVMLDQKRIDKQTLAKHPSFANDLEFAASLQKSGGFSKGDIDEMIKAQVRAIVLDVLSWPQGDWHFSPLARLRADIRYQVDVQNPFLDHARAVPNEIVVQRFRSLDEAFAVRQRGVENLLQSHELYILGCFGDSPLTIEQLRGKSTLPEAGMLQALYVLWLGGILIRLNWNSAFSKTKLDDVRSATLHRVKAAADLVTTNDESEPATQETSEPAVNAADLSISLEEFLKRVESAETHYDTLGIPNDADLPMVKQTYFGLAKLFHPDKYHRESADMQKRIQAAFTELSHAYEILKNDESRDSYDFKMRKEIEARAKRQVEGQAEPTETDVRTETALESFEQGIKLLNEEEYDQAAVLIGRAVHYSPDNAQFHAYYGQALSFFDAQVHKAEAEFQTAIRLDPKNVKFRMMLVDFFIDMNMTKRAVGELNRFLEVVPGNGEAIKRLQRLQPVTP